jgi:hypothetical protein
MRTNKGQKKKGKRKNWHSSSCNQRFVVEFFHPHHLHHQKAIHIAPAANGSHPAQPFFSSDTAEEVVEAMTSMTGFCVVTV